MSTFATVEHSIQRQFSLTHGGGKDHAGTVSVSPIADFNLDSTIFTTLEGALPRLFMTAKIAKTTSWNDSTAKEIESSYNALLSSSQPPPISEEILHFMKTECDFNAEHADGSFMEHLVYGYEYGHYHYPNKSAIVMLLHSIMGTATNTFAMSADKIPILKELLTEFEFLHISSFPSFLRLMYEPTFFKALRDEKHRISDLKGIRFHRVIDNEPMELITADLWVQLNYHLMHFVDFLPVANWQTHRSDPLLQMFEQLSIFLEEMNQRQALVHFPLPSEQFQKPIQETLSFGSHLSNWIPAALKMKLATKAIRKFSDTINHTLSFELIW